MIDTIASRSLRRVFCRAGSPEKKSIKVLASVFLAVLFLGPFCPVGSAVSQDRGLGGYSFVHGGLAAGIHLF